MMRREICVGTKHLAMFVAYSEMYDPLPENLDPEKEVMIHRYKKGEKDRLGLDPWSDEEVDRASKIAAEALDSLSVSPTNIRDFVDDRYGCLSSWLHRNLRFELSDKVFTLFLSYFRIKTIRF